MWGTPPQLGAEMAEIERGVERAVSIRENRGHRIAEEMRIDDLPVAVTPCEFEQTLAGADMEPV
jgi:hypothetical protein